MTVRVSGRQVFSKPANAPAKVVLAQKTAGSGFGRRLLMARRIAAMDGGNKR